MLTGRDLQSFIDGAEANGYAWWETAESRHKSASRAPQNDPNDLIKWHNEVAEIYRFGENLIRKIEQYEGNTLKVGQVASVKHFADHMRNIFTRWSVTKNTVITKAEAIRYAKKIQRICKKDQKNYRRILRQQTGFFEFNRIKRKYLDVI